MQLAQGPAVTSGSTEPPQAGHTALQMIDKLLAERPVKVGHDFSEATRCLAAFRDDLIRHCRRNSSNEDRERLAKVNMVLAVIVGAHFPLAGIPWSQIEQARTLLVATLGS